MKASATVLAVAALLVGAAHLTASGPMGIYGIVEKVVVEPSETAPERIRCGVPLHTSTAWMVRD